jgi:hypothetical protein
MTVADHQRDIALRPWGSGRAVTLVEMVVSLTIVSILLGACGSVMLLASRVIGISAAGPAVSMAVADAAADQVAADLHMALQITERTATAVTFTVPDRNGDSTPETLRYAWAGAGSPLTRQYNGQPAPAASMAENVQLFNLDWLLRTAGPPPPVESPEQLLVSRDWPMSDDRKAYTIKSNAWAAEYFKPVLPANAISWKITRVKVKLARNGTNTGTMTIGVRFADASMKPTDNALDSLSVDAVTLSTTFTWVEFGSSCLDGLDPALEMCVLVTTTDSDPGVVEYDNKGPAVNMRFSKSTNQGSTWILPTDHDVLQIYVYGTVTTPP